MPSLCMTRNSVHHLCLLLVCLGQAPQDLVTITTQRRATRRAVETGIASVLQAGVFGPFSPSIHCGPSSVFQDVLGAPHQPMSRARRARTFKHSFCGRYCHHRWWWLRHYLGDKRIQDQDIDSLGELNQSDAAVGTTTTTTTMYRPPGSARGKRHSLLVQRIRPRPLPAHHHQIWEIAVAWKEGAAHSLRSPPLVEARTT
jgi:hypothetical protein